MALATDTTQGEVILNGDIHASPDAHAPELTPTGVAPGTYTLPTLVVDAKGRVLWAQEDDIEVPCASALECGVVMPGKNITFTPLTSKIAVPLATTTSKGVVEIGSGFVVDGCCLVQDFPEATTTTLGLVKVPTSGNIDVDGSGNISLPLATESSVGVMQVGNGLDVTAGVVTLDVTELTLPNATESSKGVMQVGNGLDVTAGVVSVDVTEITFPKATEISTGVMQVGNGLDVTAGVVSVDVTEITFPNVTTSTKGVVQIGSGIDVSAGLISIPDATTSTKGKCKGDEITVNVNDTTNIISVPIAGASTLGVIRVGDNLGIDGNGVLARGQGDATESSKGIMQVGTGLDVSAGVVSVDVTEITFPNATTSTKGVVQIGDNVDVTAGVISVEVGSDTSKGIVQPGTGLGVSSGILSIDTATNSTLGVVKSADTTHIDLTLSGGIDTGADVGLVDVQQTWTARQTTTLNTLTIVGSPATVVLDLALSNIFTLSLTESCTLSAPTNAVAGQVFTIIVKQDATGGRTLLFASDYKFQTTPTITAAANAVDLIHAVCVSPTEFICVHTQDYS